MPADPAPPGGWRRCQQPRRPPQPLPGLPLVVAFLLLRAAVGLHPHSGEGTPPMYGDFEAHRHWMELTAALPPRDWYTAGPANDLGYWGLDYPPLMAWASRAAASLVAAADGAAMAPGRASRGYESPAARAAMRAVALGADALAVLPPLLAAPRLLRGHPRGAVWAGWALGAAVAACPAAVLVDHGHYQFNGVPTGLLLAALVAWEVGGDGAAAAAGARSVVADAAGAAALTAAVAFKQTTAVWGPPAAALLLSRAVARARGGGTTGAAAAAAYAVAVAGAVVAVLVAACWPWLVGGRPALAGLAARLVPVDRGLYEDKVANLWCVLSVVVKAQRLASRRTLLGVAAAASATAAAPFVAAVAVAVAGSAGGGRHGAPPRHPPGTVGAVMSAATAGCAAGAFLCGYQVHEKHILQVLAPLAVLAPAAPRVVATASALAAFTLYPLLHREGLATAYAGVQAVHAVVFGRHLWAGALAPAAAVHAATAAGVVSVPGAPDAAALLFAGIGCVGVLALYVWLLGGVAVAVGWWAPRRPCVRRALDIVGVAGGEDGRGGRGKEGNDVGRPAGPWAGVVRGSSSGSSGEGFPAGKGEAPPSHRGGGRRRRSPQP